MSGVMTTVKLHGSLGKEFGREFRFSVHSAAEAVRALTSQVKGFMQYIEHRSYQVFLGPIKRGRVLGLEQLHLRVWPGEAEIHIVPRIRGRKENGLGKILLGGLLIAASFVIPGSWAILGKSVSVLVGNLGIAMVLGGISQMLAPSLDSNADRDQPKSDLFGSAVNVTTPGVGVPVVIGECEVGSVVISAAVHVEDRP